MGAEADHDIEKDRPHVAIRERLLQSVRTADDHRVRSAAGKLVGAE